jgi:hypothetical protein
MDANVLVVVVRIGQETLLEENLPDDEIEIELAPIAVQLAYVQQVRLLHHIKLGSFLLLMTRKRKKLELHINMEREREGERHLNPRVLHNSHHLQSPILPNL